jgi:hypothetical protein
MTDAVRFALSWVAAALIAIGLAACGGDDSQATETTTSAQPPSQQIGSNDRAEPQPSSNGAGKSKSRGDGTESSDSSGSSDSGGGAAAFRVPGGDNSIQDFGEEADESERDQAAVALQGYLGARAAEDWPTACSYLPSAGRRNLEQLAAKSGKFTGCPQIIAALSGGQSEEMKATLLAIDVGSFRLEGDRAYILYHGAEEADYFMPMVKEDGEWKVGGLAPSPLG